MRLFTSRYQNRAIAETDLVPVGITLGNPRFKLAFKVVENVKLLAPPRSMWGKSHDEFIKLYRECLSGFGLEKILSILKRISDEHGGRDLVLLCFEDVFCDDPTKNFCHRRVFAEWWEKETGDVVEELQPAEQPEQLRMF